MLEIIPTPASSIADCLKNVVYANSLHMIAELKTNIATAIAYIRLSCFAESRDSNKSSKRINFCIDKRGCHYKHLLQRLKFENKTNTLL